MNKAIIYIDGLIGNWENEKGVELTDVISQVKQYNDFEEIEVRINSLGGVVQVGYDIYSYLRSFKKPVTTIAENICASIASVIFLAGDKRLMRPGAILMIHNPWGQPAGDADALQEYSNELRKIEKSLVDFYDKKTSIGKEALSALMRQETEMDADEAVKLGFATGMAEEKKIVAYIKIGDMSKGKKTLKEQLNGILAKLSGNALGLTIQDATGTELVFETENENPSVGDKATVDGNPANGEYTMPDGKIFLFDNGELKEIKESSDDDDDDDDDDEDIKNVVREIVKEELAGIRNEVTEGLQLVVDATGQLTEKYAVLAKSVKSSYKPPKEDKKKKLNQGGDDDVYSKFRPNKEEE